MEEVDKQVKDMVASQKQSDDRIAGLEAKLQEQKLRNERLEAILRGYKITLVDKITESARETSLEENLNKDSEREESEATLRGQKKSKDQTPSTAWVGSRK
jgi:hypothetical protein